MIVGSNAVAVTKYCLKIFTYKYQNTYWQYIVFTNLLTNFLTKYLQTYSENIFAVQKQSMSYILELFLNFSKFEPRYNYKLYSYKKL